MISLTATTTELAQYLNALSLLVDMPAVTGNVYVVLPSDNSNFPQFNSQFNKKYADQTDFIQPTLTAALGVAVSGRNDVIFLAPGYSETLTAAAGQTITKNNITVIGLGNGRARPTFNYTTAVAASFDVTGNNVTLKNLVFNPTGVDAVTAAINVTGTDFLMDGCEMQICTANKGVVLGILTAATATRFAVRNSRFIGPASNSGTTCTAIIKHEVGIDFEIRDNFFMGKMTQGILNATTILGGRIHNNVFHVYTGTKGIALAAGTTCVISNNRIVVPSGTAPTVAAGATHIGNIYGTEALTIGTPTAAAF